MRPLLEVRLDDARSGELVLPVGEQLHGMRAVPFAGDVSSLLQVLPCRRIDRAMHRLRSLAAWVLRAYPLGRFDAVSNQRFRLLVMPSERCFSISERGSGSRRLAQILVTIGSSTATRSDHEFTGIESTHVCSTSTANAESLEIRRRRVSHRYWSSTTEIHTHEALVEESGLGSGHNDRRQFEVETRWIGEFHHGRNQAEQFEFHTG